MRRPAEEQKKLLVGELIGARQQMLDAVRALPSDACDAVFLGEWCANDIVAHLAGWDYSNIDGIRAVLDGRLPDFYAQYDADWHTFNAGLVRRYKQPSMTATLEAAGRSHAALLLLLESIPAQDVVKDHGVRSPRGRRVTVAMLISAEASDERKHAGQVAAFASAWATGSRSGITG